MQKYIVSREISNGLCLIENKQKKEANGGKLKIKSKDFLEGSKILKYYEHKKDWNKFLESPFNFRGINFLLPNKDTLNLGLIVSRTHH